MPCSHAILGACCGQAVVVTGVLWGEPGSFLSSNENKGEGGKGGYRIFESNTSSGSRLPHISEAADAEKTIKNWGYNSVLQRMRGHAQWLRELDLAFIDRDLHRRRRAENGFGSTRRKLQNLLQGHGRMLMNNLRFPFESAGDGCGLQKNSRRRR